MDRNMCLLHIKKDKTWDNDYVLQNLYVRMFINNSTIACDQLLVHYSYTIKEL